MLTASDLLWKTNSSNINFLVAGSSVAPDNSRSTYAHQQVSDIGNISFKNNTAAFAELKQGKAYIASYYGTSSKVSIRNAF